MHSFRVRGVRDTGPGTDPLRPGAFAVRRQWPYGGSRQPVSGNGPLVFTS